MHLLAVSSSGEGLIFEVRDPSPGDSGASDKRRLIIESEFAQILKVLAREGNTLSARGAQRVGRKALADDRQERAGARDRRAHRDHRPHHQGRAAAVRLRHRARQRVRQSLPARRRQTQPGAAVRRPPRRRAARARARRRPWPRCGSPACPASSPSTPTRGSGGSTSTGRCPAARKACSAPPPAAPKRTSSASPRSTPRSTPASRSPCRTSKPRSRSGATASTPPAGSSATRSATPPPTRSGRSPKTAPAASPAARSATSSAVLWRATKRLFCSRIRYVPVGGGGQ